MTSQSYKEQFDEITRKIDESPSLADLKVILEESVPNILNEGAKLFFHKVSRKLNELGASGTTQSEIIELVKNKSTSDCLSEKCQNMLFQDLDNI